MLVPSSYSSLPLAYALEKKLTLVTLFESVLKPWIRFIRKKYPGSARKVPVFSILVSLHKNTMWHSYHVCYLLNVYYAPDSILWVSPLNSGNIIILVVFIKGVEIHGR